VAYQRNPGVIILPRMNVVWPPQSSQATWYQNSMVLDANFDLWVCVTAGKPGVWKKLSGGGGGGGNLVAENLTSQVNGVTDTFTTGSARQGGTIRVYLNGQDLGTPGTLVAGAHVEELSVTQFKIDVVPRVGEELHVTYFV
jgi:hypothetical protein